MQDSPTVTTKPIKSLNIFGQPTMIFGLPVDQKTIFCNHKGVYKKRIEKRQRKLIVKTALIKFFLQSNERIFCLTSGYSPITILDQVLTGLAFLLFKRAIFVFTDRRLLHVPIRCGSKSHRSVAQILYGDCVHMTLKGRALVVQLKDGRQEAFPYIGRREKKKIKALIDAIAFQPESPAQSKSRRYLCPRCTHLLPDRIGACPSCQLKFKSPLQAAIRAALIPGGGYFFSRYPLLGIFFVLLELMLTGFWAIQWYEVTKGFSTGYILLATLTSGFLIEKTITTYHARQLVSDFLPVNKDFSVQKNTQPAGNSYKQRSHG